MRPYLPEYFDQPELPRKTITSFFKRYADGGTSDLHIHMPQRLLPTTVSHCPLEVLVGHWEKYLEDPSSAREHFPWAARFVMGMNLGQKSRFISAVWSGGDLGSYLTNGWYEPLSVGRALAENSEILIDGQQRLHSLEEYLLDRLAVPDAQGQPRIWSELGNGERRRFLSTIFTHARVFW